MGVGLCRVVGEMLKEGDGVGWCDKELLIESVPHIVNEEEGDKEGL